MKFISKMNRIDWVDNIGPVIRRGEEIEMDECDLTDTWLEMGYVSVGADQPTVSADSKPIRKPKKNIADMIPNLDQADAKTEKAKTT